MSLPAFLTIETNALSQSNGASKTLLRSHHRRQDEVSMHAFRSFFREQILELEFQVTLSLSVGTVCRLYFDIEYKLELNPGVPAIPTLETFIEVVCRCL